MAHEQLRAKVEAMGLSRLVYLESMAFDGVFAVAPDTDFDGRFKAMDLETQQVGWVNGWNWSLRDGAEDRAEVAREWWDWREPAAPADPYDAARALGYPFTPIRPARLGYSGAPLVWVPALAG